jgi:hypothetical protein
VPSRSGNPSVPLGGLLPRLEEAQSPPVTLSPPATLADGGGTPSTPPSLAAIRRSTRDRSTARVTFQVWVVIYALVGAQMGWILRPFIGAPEMPFQWFRHREANIFVDIAHTISKLLGS